MYLQKQTNKQTINLIKF